MATPDHKHHATAPRALAPWGALPAGAALLLLGACNPPGGSATLTWQAPTRTLDGAPLVGLAGYTIYYGDSPQALLHAVRVPDPQATRYVVHGLEPGKTYFSIAAYTASGQQSGLSAPVSKDIPP